ncbi:hypothetical protein DY000_02053961 [Brassica cretica]|uniref:Uncharacterized protein n=1 Tax=Brassica cretica TaxID=69181 RepID=A0ABQ7AMU4_BRACR|nr:hypothetical protein DY000_02053961 [Brassica cretica]
MMDCEMQNDDLMGLELAEMEDKTGQVRADYVADQKTQKLADKSSRHTKHGSKLSASLDIQKKKFEILLRGSPHKRSTSSLAARAQVDWYGLVRPDHSQALLLFAFTLSHSQLLKPSSHILINSFQHVGGADYGSVRDEGIELLETEASLDYLCKLSPHGWEHKWLNPSIHVLSFKKIPFPAGSETFIDEYLDHDDPVTVIDEKLTKKITLSCYTAWTTVNGSVFSPSRVSDGGGARKREIVISLARTRISTAVAYVSYVSVCHYSYSACGLGSNGTDRLVQLVQGMQHNNSKSEDGTLYGAKITGGGSGYWP